MQNNKIKWIIIGVVIIMIIFSMQGKKEATSSKLPNGDTSIIDNPSFEILDNGWGEEANTWIISGFNIMGYTTNWFSKGSSSFYFKRNANMGVSCYEGEFWAIHQDIDLTNMNYISFDSHIINNDGIPFNNIFNQQWILLGPISENCARGTFFNINVKEGNNIWQIPADYKTGQYNVCIRLGMSPGCYNPINDVTIYFDNFRISSSPLCNTPADTDCNTVISWLEMKSYLIAWATGNPVTYGHILTWSEFKTALVAWAV